MHMKKFVYELARQLAFTI